jgi:hypothetical protein
LKIIGRTDLSEIYPTNFRETNNIKFKPLLFCIDPEDGGSKLRRNVCNYLPIDMALYPGGGVRECALWVFAGNENLTDEFK